MSALRATDEKASRSHKHTKTGSRKEAAIEFLRLASSGKVREAFRAHAGPGFRHHNPFFHGDAESLMAAMEEMRPRTRARSSSSSMHWRTETWWRFTGECD